MKSIFVFLMIISMAAQAQKVEYRKLKKGNLETVQEVPVLVWTRAEILKGPKSFSWLIASDEPEIYEYVFYPSNLQILNQNIHEDSVVIEFALHFAVDLNNGFLLYNETKEKKVLSEFEPEQVYETRLIDGTPYWIFQISIPLDDTDDLFLLRTEFYTDSGIIPYISPQDILFNLTDFQPLYLDVHRDILLDQEILRMRHTYRKIK